MHQSKLYPALKASKTPRTVFCLDGDFVTMLPTGVRFIHMYNDYPYACMGTYTNTVPERDLEEDIQWMLARK